MADRRHLDNDDRVVIEDRRGGGAGEEGWKGRWVGAAAPKRLCEARGVGDVTIITAAC